MVVRNSIAILFFCFGFLRVIRTTFVELVRHSASGLDLLETNPAMSLLSTNCFQNDKSTILSFFEKKMSSLLWLLTADPLLKKSVVFAEFSKR